MAHALGPYSLFVLKEKLCKAEAIAAVETLACPWELPACTGTLLPPFSAYRGKGDWVTKARASVRMFMNASEGGELSGLMEIMKLYPPGDADMRHPLKR